VKWQMVGNVSEPCPVEVFDFSGSTAAAAQYGLCSVGPIQ
jgi:hypothetical protein